MVAFLLHEQKVLQWFWHPAVAQWVFWYSLLTRAQSLSFSSHAPVLSWNCHMSLQQVGRQQCQWHVTFCDMLPSCLMWCHVNILFCHITTHGKNRWQNTSPSSVLEKMQQLVTCHKGNSFSHEICVSPMLAKNWWQMTCCNDKLQHVGNNSNYAPVNPSLFSNVCSIFTICNDPWVTGQPACTTVLSSLSRLSRLLVSIFQLRN